MKKYTILLAAACLMAACSEEKASQALPSVTTTSPERASDETEKNFSGVVKENAETSLSFRTGGTIEQIYVKEGDRVRQGQLLAQLDDKDYKLTVEAVQIQYDQLKAEVERLRILYEGNSLSGNDYEKACSGLEQLGVQLQANKNQLSYTRLYAPCDGYVQHVDHERAEMVGAGTPVVTLLDVRRLEVEISIPKSLYLQQDQIASVRCTADGQQYSLRLINIVPKADNSQLYTARLEVDAPASGTTTESGGLKAGQSVDVILTVAANQDARPSATGCTLPLSAIFEHEGQSCVWVVTADSTVRLQPVATSGTDASGRIIVTSGLQGDETVVRAGVHALHDSQRVRVIPVSSATNVGNLL